MDLGLQDRAVLITGGSSNIGAATAVAFGREGSRVTLTYRSNRDSAGKIAQQIEEAGGKAHIVQFDLNDQTAPERLVQETTAHWGGLDVLVNNAVEWGDVLPGDSSPRFDERDNWEKHLEPNLVGHLRVTHAAIPALRAGDQGRIVSVSSDLATRGMRGAVTYTAAKAGLHGATRSLAWELGPDKVLVNILVSGLVIDGRELPADFPEAIVEEWKKQVPLKRLPLTHELANTIVFLCSAANGGITGETIRVTGGIA